MTDTSNTIDSETHSTAAALRPRDSLRPLTLPEQLAERIYLAIVNGELQPGERIREEDLASEYQVSRGPAREALRILEKDSVVSIIPNRGAHVSRLSVKEVNDIFEIRKVLNGLMIRRFIRSDDAFVATVDAGVRELERLSKFSNGRDYAQATARLSMIFAGKCDNAKLADIIRSLARQTLRYTQLGLADPKRRIESMKNWRRIVVALKAGDFDAAAAATEKLIDDSRREAVRQLEAPEANRAAQQLDEATLETAKRPTI